MASLNEPGRPLLVRGPPAGLRYVVLAGIAVALMVVDHRQQRLEQFRAFLSVAASPLHWLAAAPGRGVAWIDETSKTRAELESENTVLAAENLRLQLRMQRFESLEQENKRLRAASASTARIVDRTLLAEILRVDLDPFRQRVLINRGSKDGVFRGQAVLDGGGVFGQVTHVGPYSSEIILISDTEHAIPVQVTRNALRTIAVGTGQPNVLDLPYLSKNSDIKVGDLLLSSGLGGVYPPGYPVARVTEVTRAANQPLLLVKAVPTAGLDRSPEVLLAWFDNRIPEIPAESDTPGASVAETAPAIAAPGGAPATPAGTTAAPAAKPATTTGAAATTTTTTATPAGNATPTAAAPAAAAPAVTGPATSEPAPAAPSTSAAPPAAATPATTTGTPQ